MNIFPHDEIEVLPFAAQMKIYEAEQKIKDKLHFYKIPLARLIFKQLKNERNQIDIQVRWDTVEGDEEGKYAHVTWEIQDILSTMVCELPKLCRRCSELANYQNIITKEYYCGLCVPIVEMDSDI
jgi:hypothetical protein